LATVGIAAQAMAQEGPCMPPLLDPGRVAAILDARTLRLSDGREVRLAGVEATVSGASDASAAQALKTLVGGRDIILRGSAKPDRYGRLTAFIFRDDDTGPVQGLLVKAGHLAVRATGSDCAADLLAQETAARRAGRGLWAEPAAIKNAEIGGDILALIGRFGVVEGKVLSVRQAGSTLYINFGRRWTRDFAVTISRRNVASFETAAGRPLKSLERRRIRVRGWIEQRGGPRIHAERPDQIELMED
jgi:endonuclease YncB( thermonuclease family)